MVAATFRVPMTKDLLEIDVPPLVTAVDRSVRQWIEESHMVLAYVLAAVVLIHIVAALRHHFVKRNENAAPHDLERNHVCHRVSKTFGAKMGKLRAGTSA